LNIVDVVIVLFILKSFVSLIDMIYCKQKKLFCVFLYLGATVDFSNNCFLGGYVNMAVAPVSIQQV